MTSPSDTPSLVPDGDANDTSQAGGYYGRGIPYLPIAGYPGKLIAIEGTDGVGRSTQIQLLRAWLEIRGYGVVETGWTRSPLMQPTIEVAKSSNTLNKLTFVLLYATDFSSRRRHTRSLRDWSSDVCSSDLPAAKVTASFFATLKVHPALG